MKSKFTLIEVILSIAIVSILFFILSQCLRSTIWTRHCNSFQLTTGIYLNSYQLRKLRDAPESIKEQFFRVANNEEPLNTQSKLKVWLNNLEVTYSDNSVNNQDDDLYTQWVEFTGNPNKLTKQQFEILKEKDLIDELKYHKWKSITNNVQNLSEEQFNTLKEADAISFPNKIKEIQNKENHNW